MREESKRPEERHAVQEPQKERGISEWGERAAGYGLVRFNVKTRQITMECWPRGVDVTASDAEQYPGWPVQIDQLDNYGRQATAWLPTIEVRGMDSPVVQVIDETYCEVVYTLRLKGTRFQPKVFRDGAYTLRIGQQPDAMRVLTGLQAKPENDAVLEITLEGQR